RAACASGCPGSCRTSRGGPSPSHIEAAGIEPGGKLRLAPPTAGVLAGGPLGRVDDVRAVHFLELPSQALVLDAVDVVDHLPEVLAGDPPLLQHHQGGEDRRKIE